MIVKEWKVFSNMIFFFFLSWVGLLFSIGSIQRYSNILLRYFVSLNHFLKVELDLSLEDTKHLIAVVGGYNDVFNLATIEKNCGQCCFCVHIGGLNEFYKGIYFSSRVPVWKYFSLDGTRCSCMQCFNRLGVENCISLGIVQ